MDAVHCDVLVIGSGAAALSAALRAAWGGLSVVVAEKTELLGGTSAMSGAGIWVPANHLAGKTGVSDSEEEALRYIRSASPDGWQDDEDALWQAFASNAPRMLEFLASATPLTFELVDQPDPFSELPGGKAYGRMLSPVVLSRDLIGPLGRTLRRSPLPHIFTYGEIYEHDLRHHPLLGVLKLWPKLVLRYLTRSRGQGTALIVGLLKGCLDAGCQIRPNMEAFELLKDSASGRVIGARFREACGTLRTVHARLGVVLATGGFEWNAELFKSHFPGPEYRVGSSPANTGDGQNMAAVAGAHLDRMDQANVYLSYPSRCGREHGGLPRIFHAAPHSIIVDRTARRFVSEGDFNLGEVADRRDAKARQPLHLPVWLIGDSRFSRTALPQAMRRAGESDGRVVTAPSIEELARKLDLPAHVLAQTVSRFNDFSDRGKDTDFHRGESLWERATSASPSPHLWRIEKPPFVGVAMDRFIVGTKGGARTNARGQVLRPDASVIAGFYAAGLAMANPFGSRGIGAGTTLGPNLTWGYICAETMLAER